MILHPITLEYITNIHNPFCAVGEWEYMDPVTKKKAKYMSDSCYRIGSDDTKEHMVNIAIANVPFNANVFLKEQYNINTIEEAIDYVENTRMPQNTEERIIEASWKAFPIDDDELIDDRIIDYFMHRIKRDWLDDIYKRFGRFIVIEKDKIYIAEDDKKNDKFVVEKKNFIINRLITRSSIDNIIRKINKSKNFNYLLVRIKRSINLYLEKKINTALN